MEGEGEQPLAEWYVSILAFVKIMILNKTDKSCWEGEWGEWGGVGGVGGGGEGRETQPLAEWYMSILAFV